MKNCFAEKFPELVSEWHPTKNGDLSPYDVTPFSDKVVWWKCPKGKDHEWKAAIKTRSKGHGCGVCHNRVVVKSNCLATLNPKLAKQWHPTKNGDLTPFDVIPGSHKKVWWKCPKGKDHEWRSVVANRNKGIGCPICSNQKVAKSNSLGTVNPKLAKEWHPTKNGKLTPFEVLPSANIKIWWQCPKGKDHVYQSKLNTRANGKGCPICSGHKVVRSNSLAVTYPEIAKQWHPTKNGSLTPEDVSRGESRKIWWKCPKGDDHEWLATINHRTRGTGCPKCNPAYSIPELRIFCELKAVFPEIQHRAIIKKNEVDIYIPSLKFGIEYDGLYWHGDKKNKDLAKNKKLSSEILLLRVREEGLPLLGEFDIQVGLRDLNISVVKKILRTIKKTRTLSSKEKERVDKYLKSKKWISEKLFTELYSRRKHVEFEKSLGFLYPDLAREWHPAKNGALLPEHFTPGSGRKIWWRGKCRHIWEDSILHRTGRSSGCPKCRYKRVSETWKKKREKAEDPQLELKLNS